MNKLTSAIKLFLRPGEGERGTALVEFGMIAPMLVLLTFAILEFSLVMFEQHRATEATRRGARQAVVGSAIADLATLSPGVDVTCTSISGTVDCGSGITVTSTATFDTILADMQAILPDITPEHVNIVYSDSGLGAMESGGIKPFVTVSLVDYRHKFIALGAVPGMPSEMTLPDFAATEVPGGFTP
jgi:hypothetical protein